MEDKKRGGKRNGAGRKKIDNHKKSVTLYVEEKKILVFGGQDKLKKKLYDTIEQETRIDYAPVTPESYDAPKNQMVVHDEPAQSASYFGTPKPIVQSKTAQQWLDEKRELQVGEEYEEWVGRLQRSGLPKDIIKKILYA